MENKCSFFTFHCLSSQSIPTCNSSLWSFLQPLSHISSLLIIYYHAEHKATRTRPFNLTVIRWISLCSETQRLSSVLVCLSLWIHVGLPFPGIPLHINDFMSKQAPNPLLCASESVIRMEDSCRLMQRTYLCRQREMEPACVCPCVCVWVYLWAWMTVHKLLSIDWRSSVSLWSFLAGWSSA